MRSDRVPIQKRMQSGLLIGWFRSERLERKSQGEFFLRGMLKQLIKPRLCHNKRYLANTEMSGFMWNIVSDRLPEFHGNLWEKARDWLKSTERNSVGL